MSRPDARFVVALLVGLVVLGSGIGAWAWFQRPKSAPVGATVKVGRGNLTETAAASGTIEPEVQVEVKSRASGAVVELLVKEGDTVAPGQLLVRLDPVDAERDLAEAKVALTRVRAELSSAQANVKLAELEKANAKTTMDLAEKSAALGLGSNDAARSAGHAAAVAEATVGLRKASVTSAAAQLETAELAVKEAELRVKETKIFAPMPGTVLDIAVEKGSIVASALTNVNGGTTVMTLADLGNLRIVGAIDEANIARVKPDQQVDIRVDAYPEKVFEGKVARVSPLGKTTSSVVTFDVEIGVVDAAASLLRSGMSADVEIVTAEQKDVLLVPLLAVQAEGARRSVRRPNGERVPIKTGATDGTKMIVLEGLQDGDEILAAAPAEPRPASAGANKGSTNPMRGMGGPPGGR